MCGIVGIFGDSNLSEIEVYISNMTNALKHRGPDSKGIWLDEKRNLALGHRRLSIIDLSDTGHQPMVSNCGRFVLSFNGEIYNHLELRKKFENLSKEKNDKELIWKGTSDTETILEGFSLIGIEQTLKKSVGMFAMAIWDLEEEKLHLTRDRMGEKPLYYGWSNKNFIFASELKAFKEYKLFNNEIDRDSINIYMRHNYIPTPRSIYKNIFKLIPGTLISLGLDDTKNNVAKLEDFLVYKGSYEDNLINEPLSRSINDFWIFSFFFSHR